MDPTSITYEITRYYTEDQSTKVSLDLINLVNGLRRSRDLENLTNCSSHFDRLRHTVEDWRFLRQVEAFFKKNASFVNQGICENAASAAFSKAEQSCAITNTKISEFVYEEKGYSPLLRKCVPKMRHYIRRVLGSFNLFTETLPSLVKVTSGATVYSSRRDSIPQLKLSLKPYCSSSAVSILKTVMNNFGFERLGIRSCDTNRIELVPKNWKRHRTIACEPEGSMALQLAFDTWMKRRFLRFGINLRDQGRNKRMARDASIFNHLATIDFEAASDTIAHHLICWLFPTRWTEYLEAVRAPRFRGKLGSGFYEKFSSMGNGTTFVIETLLFAAMCYAVGSRKFSVYGDDVIIEREFFSEYCALSAELGFTVNIAKSFADGPFRESCGGDYFNGTDVTPVYIRKLDSRKAILCHLINTVSNISVPFGALWKYLDSLIGEFRLPLVPWNESTISGVWINPEIARRTHILVRRKLVASGPRLDYFRSYSCLTRSLKFQDIRGYYLWFLYRNRQVSFHGEWVDQRPYDPLTTSRVPVFRHRYVRKWVVWHVPNESMPDAVLFRRQQP